VSIVPGFISRSVAGSYDNEAVAIFALLLSFYLFVRAVKTGSMLWAAATAIGYFYMVAAWGGYIYITNLLPLYALVMVLFGRFSHRLYIAYSVVYVLGTLMSMQVFIVEFKPVRTAEHMPALGVFCLLQVYGFLQFVLFRTNFPPPTTRSSAASLSSSWSFSASSSPSSVHMPSSGQDDS
jgi:dolichyl-diphosphooligosaccharide--protein glycosyltransferase